MKTQSNPLACLRHHVSGAIARGEAVAITEKPTAQTAYLRAYRDAMAALKAIETAIYDLPAPDGETPINWANVGDMNRIKSALLAVTAK
jgi:hypothetical protein